MTGRRLVLGITAALIAGGFLMLRAEATPLTRAADSLTVLKGYSQVQKAGCIFGTTRCPAGTKWSCKKSSATAGAVKKCWCRPC